MKIKSLFILVLFSVISCDGTLGGFKDRNFAIPKKNIEKAVDTLFAENPQLNIPKKWEEYDTWKKRGYDFLDSRIFYFQTEPEEMYYVSFVSDGNENQDKDGPTIIAIRSVFTKRHKKWKEEAEFDDIEKVRIENRFDSEIVSKLERYSGVKSNRLN